MTEQENKIFKELSAQQTLTAGYYKVKNVVYYYDGKDKFKTTKSSKFPFVPIQLHKGISEYGLSIMGEME